MNGSRVATSSFGTALWLMVSLGMLLWVAFTVSGLLHAATQVIQDALHG